MISSEQIKAWLEAGMPDAQIIVEGDDGHHFAATIISNQFIDQSTIMRHRMVYAVLGERMGHEIHALSLRTLTEKEYNKHINLVEDKS